MDFSDFIIPFVDNDVCENRYGTVLICLSGYVINHNMSDQRQKKQRTLSALSSLFRVPRNPPASPNNAVQAGMAMPSSSASMLPGAPISSEPLASSSMFLPLIETVNESPNRRIDPNT